MELSLVKSNGLKRKCNVPGCKNDASFVIVGIKPSFPICEKCLTEIKKAIEDEVEKTICFEKLSQNLQTKRTKKRTQNVEIEKI